MKNLEYIITNGKLVDLSDKKDFVKKYKDRYYIMGVDYDTGSSFIMGETEFEKYEHFETVKKDVYVYRRRDC